MWWPIYSGLSRKLSISLDVYVYLKLNVRFSLLLLYLINDTKRIRHKFYQLMESSPIYTIIITLCWECTWKQENTILSITDKGENNHRIKRNEEEVCACVCVCVWMLDGVYLEHVHLNDKFNVRSMSYVFFVLGIMAFNQLKSFIDPATVHV